MHSRLANVRSTLRPHLTSLSSRRPALYAADLLVTCGIGWSTFLVGAGEASGPLSIGRIALLAFLFALAVLALYRASSFMHEVTHVRGAMPLYAIAWDVLVGVPLLLPSLLYTDVHTTHHDHKIFGTERDPEFVQHQGEGRTGHLATVCGFAITPVLLLARWLVIAPLSFVHPRLRRFVIERLSSFASNPRYRRPPPEGAEARRWHVLEAACFAWTVLVVGLAAAGALPLASLAFAALVLTSVSVMHGLRSLTTHRFHGDGAPRTVDEQFLDSINVTGHPIWTELWAPAGLRYHALHHFAPRLPYHALGRAHRLLMASLPADDAYRSVTFDGLAEVVRHVIPPASPLPRRARRRVAFLAPIALGALLVVPSVAAGQASIPSPPSAYVGWQPTSDAARATESYDGECSGEPPAVRRCRIRQIMDQLRERLLLVEAEMAGSDHPDDTAPAWLVAGGLTTFAAGFIGTFVEGAQPACSGSPYATGVFASGSGCVAREGHWPLIGSSIALAGTGLLSAIVGIVWLTVNGAPFRRRDSLRRQLERLEDRIELDASIAPDGGTLRLTLAF
jgi:fatty acid desaturase